MLDCVQGHRFGAHPHGMGCGVLLCHEGGMRRFYGFAECENLIGDCVESKLTTKPKDWESSRLNTRYADYRRNTVWVGECVWN